MASIFVTGCNRGIGLGLVRQLVQEPTVSLVFATARNLENATDLKAINSPKLHLIQLDVVNSQSIADAVTKVSAEVGDNGLDFLVNNAGIFVKARLDDENLSEDLVMKQLEVNIVAPIMITNKFHELLKKAADKNGSSQVANISSIAGSLETAADHSRYALPAALYAMSKASLNMLTRKLSLEWKNEKIRATSFCPGWVKTDMGGEKATLSLEDSTVPLVKLILSVTEEHNGHFHRYNGEKIPW